MPTDKLTFVFGAPRSGTTWLAKMLDSHPRVLYRHEPDISRRNKDIPAICGPDQEDRYVEPMRHYVEDLLRTRTVKAAGSLPVFRKAFDTPLSFAARSGSAYALRAVEKMLSEPARRRLAVPCSGYPRFGQDILPVIKSVTSLGRVGVMMKAVPSARAVLILRNPFGQVASCLDGLARGKFERPGGFDRRLLDTDHARQFGLTEEAIDGMTLVEQLTWDWAVTNSIALDQVRDAPRVRIIRYMDLLNAPLERAKDLFAFVGLSWAAATERFIDESTRYHGPDSYYRVFRDAEAQKQKWRSRIDATMHRQIVGVMRASALDRLWPELAA